MARVARIIGLLGVVLGAQAATLEFLPLDEMITKSTAIIRGRVAGASASLHGPLIYTHYTVQVLERWKGPEAAGLDVVVPGGAVQGVRQTFSGAPELAVGNEYLLFLWTGSSGLTHIVGLSQGVFTLDRDNKGEVTANRAIGPSPMLDPKTGRVVADQPLRMLLRDLHSRVSALTAGGTVR